MSVSVSFKNPEFSGLQKSQWAHFNPTHNYLVFNNLIFSVLPQSIERAKTHHDMFHANRKIYESPGWALRANARSKQGKSRAQTVPIRKFQMSLTEHFNLHGARMGLIMGIEGGARIKPLVMQFVCIFNHQRTIRKHTLTSVIGQFVAICKEEPFSFYGTAPFLGGHRKSDTISFNLRQMDIWTYQKILTNSFNLSQIFFFRNVPCKESAKRRM